MLTVAKPKTIACEGCESVYGELEKTCWTSLSEWKHRLKEATLDPTRGRLETKLLVDTLESDIAGKDDQPQNGLGRQSSTGHSLGK
eukprot:1316098-Amphidinium_carterae.2